VIVRSATPDDAEFLAAMITEAAYWRPDQPTPPVDVALARQAVAKYVEGWPRPGDGGVIAVDDDRRPIGAAWWRAFTADLPGDGYVDDDTPEVAIGVVPDARGRGVGRSLLLELHDAARAAGWARLVLSVERDNDAMRLYEQVGYVEVGGHPGAATMVVDLR
jgi:GNAT superfamily N-acetyltransferase